MIENFEELFYVHNKDIPLFLPTKKMVEEKQWIVCAIMEDCGCLDVFDEQDYIEKAIKYYEYSKYFTSFLFFMGKEDMIVTKIESNQDVCSNMELSIDTSLTLRGQYYESYAITNDKQDFLILHSHGDDTTFICGKEDFVKFIFETDSINEFMSNYHRCISKERFCEPFPWDKVGVNNNRYF
jgi:hypothetical protein